MTPVQYSKAGGISTRQTAALEQALSLLQIDGAGERKRVTALIDARAPEFLEKFKRAGLLKDGAWPTIGESKEGIEQALRYLALGHKMLAQPHVEFYGTATDGDPDPERRAREREENLRLGEMVRRLGETIDGISAILEFRLDIERFPTWESGGGHNKNAFRMVEPQPKKAFTEWCFGIFKSNQPPLESGWKTRFHAFVPNVYEYVTDDTGAGLITYTREITRAFE